MEFIYNLLTFKSAQFEIFLVLTQKSHRSSDWLKNLQWKIQKL